MVQGLTHRFVQWSSTPHQRSRHTDGVTTVALSTDRWCKCAHRLLPALSRFFSVVFGYYSLFSPQSLCASAVLFADLCSPCQSVRLDNLHFTVTHTHTHTHAAHK